MESLFIVLSFIGVFAAGFFCRMLLAFSLIMHEQDKQLKKYKRKPEGSDMNV